MSRKYNNCITALEYANKILPPLSGTSSSCFLALFSNVTGASVGTASASVNLAFLFRNRILKSFLKKT